MKKKFYITTTIPATFVFFKDNLKFLNQYYEVCAISSEKNNLEAVGKSEGVSTYYIPMVRPISLANDILSLWRFFQFFVKERPDIVHGNTPKASLLSMLAAKIAGVKIRIYMCHGLRYQGTTGVMRWLLVQMEKITSYCATEVICVSHGVRNALIEEGICNNSKAVVVNHGSAGGIDLNRFNINSKEKLQVRKKLGLLSTDFVFVFAGRLVADKGINELIKAFVSLNMDHPNVSLILVGIIDGELNPISDETKNEIKSHRSIHAVGWQKDIRPYLLSSDAFVLPSYREGFGMVLVEAGALGLPCITTDISGCNEIIIPGENGEIIPPRDENALYNKMKEWVEQPEKVASMAAKSRELVAGRYEQKLVWEALLEEYKRLENCTEDR